MNNKINVVFLVNELFCNLFISFYNECKKHDDINVTVLALPHVGDGGVSSLEVSEYLANHNIDYIDADNHDGTFLDLTKFNPDYVFYTTPYDFYYPNEYMSHIVSKYAKVCCVSYGISILKLEKEYECLETNPFLKNAYRFFVETKDSNILDICENAHEIGYLKLDYYKNNVARQNNHNKLVVWKPRWTLSYDSTFEKYYDVIYNYFSNHSDIKFSVFFHHLMKIRATNNQVLDAFLEKKEKLENLPNFIECSYSDFLETVLSANLLITDVSSTWGEFATTGSPMIYCNSDAKLNELGNRFKEVSYSVDSEEEMINKLDDLLYNNIDPLKDKRIKNKDSYYFIPPNNMNSGQYLYKFILEDYREGRN